MAEILIVDDDAHIREVVRFALEKAGHRVAECADGAAALASIDARRPDLVILDIIMPELDGLDVCRELRARSRVPILFLSSRDDELDRIVGLEIGADDYVTKPFSPRELVARVKALLRRAAAPPSAEATAEPMRRGEHTLDVARHRCSWREVEVELTAMEFTLLRSLMGAAGRVYTRDELVDRVWGNDYAITDRTVDSHVRRLRRKFAEVGADPIETVYGVGYRLRE